MDKLITAISENVRSNRWYRIETYHMDAYIRITSRYLHGIFTNTIELANIKVDDEYQNQRHFSNFLYEIEQLAVENGRSIYIESIMNSYLKTYLHRHKYVQDSLDLNSLYKII